ncbi:hypothetical protein ANO11243_020040 [Dothideomycetidae sp. 11243]|nr:hypothetical protein ANO11243_020040 [fungal sp. No.11243]
MAHALQVADDCRKLVSCIIEQNGQSLTDQVLEQSNRSAVKEVRATHFSRTNQFDVEKQLDGLEEKFSVLNNDALAYALQKLRTELKDSSYDFTPEVLSLLLLLSDRPAEKTRITDLVDETHVPETALLTWRDILAEDPLTEEGIWDYIERGSHSSGYVSNDEEFPTRDRPSKDWRNSKDFELNRQLLDSLSLPVTTAELETFRDKAKKTASSTFASDISFVKELLRTLQGLSRSHPINQPEETDMGQDFHIDGSLASSTLSNIRSEVRGIAKSITWLRNWTASPSTDVLQQRQRHIASRWLHEFDLQLSSIETRCIDKDHHTIITPQSVFDEVVALSMPITLLGDLAIQAADYSASFALLDGLYFRCSTSDVCGQMQDLKRLSSFFLPCLMVYLSVFEDWMSSGSAPAVSSDESFVFRIKDGHSVNLSNLWHDRFEIVHHNGAPNVLSFLSEHVSKLFTCGKSAAFLKALGTEPERTPRAALYFTEETMITPHDSYTVSAFDDRFRQSLLEWLRASYDVSAGRLGQVLLNKHYLGETMAALGSVLLGGNGNAMEEFALTLYELMDTESSEKGVRQSTLTALAQSAWEVDLHDAKLERALLMSFDTKTAASSGFLDGLRISLEVRDKIAPCRRASASTDWSSFLGRYRTLPERASHATARQLSIFYSSCTERDTCSPR